MFISGNFENDIQSPCCRLGKVASRRYRTSVYVRSPAVFQSSAASASYSGIFNHIWSASMTTASECSGANSDLIRVDFPDPTPPVTTQRVGFFFPEFPASRSAMMFSCRAARAGIHSPVAGFRKIVLVGFPCRCCIAQSLVCFAFVTDPHN
jgi:hypothetical protein